MTLFCIFWWQQKISHYLSKTFKCNWKILIKHDNYTNDPNFYGAVANAPVPVTEDMSFKVPVNLKLQPRRHTDTLIFISIHLMYVMIHFVYRKLKKIIVPDNFFQIWHLFIFYLYCNYKKIRWRYNGSAFLELKAPVFKMVLRGTLIQISKSTNISVYMWK